MVSQTIELNNVGPVSHITIPVPEGGGIIVLRGRNGAGKSKTLEAIDHAISKRGKLDVKDGQKNGEFIGFGVTIKVGSRTTRRGDLVVESLEGKLSVAELVDPGIKAPEAADIRRIKALVQLANVLPSADLFYPLLGSREALEAVVGTSALASEDLVTMADRIKRDLHQAALTTESNADTTEGRARGAREGAAGIDVNVETNASILQANYNAAVREQERIRADRASAAKARQAAQVAREQMEAAAASYTGPTTTQASIAEQEATATQAAAEMPVRNLAEGLRAAEHARDLAKQGLASSELTHSQSQQQLKKAETAVANGEATIRSLEEQLRIAKQHLDSAKEQLAEWTTTCDKSRLQHEQAATASEKAVDAVSDLKSRLQAAQQINERACQAVANCVANRKTAEQHEAAMAQWRQQVNAEVIEPSEDELAAAINEVARCHTASEQATLARRAKQQLAEADAHAADAVKLRERAVQLREAAKGTDDVLSEVVARSSEQLRVEVGRLVLDTERGVTYFGDLSQGERWKIALDIAIDAVGPKGVLMIPQEAYESLDPTNRKLINDHVRGRNVTILTAEASDDEEIVAEQFIPTVDGSVVRPALEGVNCK